MSRLKRAMVLWPICLLALPAATGGPVPGPAVDSPETSIHKDPEDRRLQDVEYDLLALVNRERASSSRPSLRRDSGMDRIMLWHVANMADHRYLSHQDVLGRETGERVQEYAGDRKARCSEIIQWWSGPPNGRAHYDGYFRSPTHHDAYMGRGAFDLGESTLAGVAAIAGSGPAGTSFEGVPGSYTGMLFCDRPLGLAVDPFAR